MRTTKMLSALLLSVLALLLSPAIRADSATTDYSNKRILLLYSYHPTFPTAPQVLAGIRAAFGSKPPTIEVEYMDSKRLYDDTSQQLYLQLLAYKLANREAYDLVITADDNALNFALSQYQGLLDETPIIFLGVNNRANALAQNENPLVTGVVEATSMDETIRLAQLMRPNMTSLHIVVDATPSGQSDLTSLLALQSEFPELSFNVLDLSRLTWIQLIERIEALNTEDALLLLSAYVDSKRESLSFEDGLHIITGAANLPILHLWEHGMGDGVTGGMIISHYQQGVAAVGLARQFFDGTPIADLPVIAESPNIPIFDVRQLKRFKINPGLLPDEADIRYQQVSLFSEYWRELGVIALVLMLMSGTIIVLARINRSRLLLARSLAAREDLLLRIINEIPEQFSTRDANGRYQLVNKEHADFYGLEPEDFIGKTEEEISPYSEQLEGRRFKLSKAVADDELQILFESIVDRHTGKTHHFRSLFEPTKDAEGKTQVIHISQNVSEILNTQAELSKSQLTMQAILDNLDAEIYMKDLDGNYLFANRKICKRFGAKAKDIIGKGDNDFFDPDTAQQLRRNDLQVIGTGEPLRNEEITRIANSDEIRTNQSTKLPLFNDKGDVYAICGISVDITERKRYEQQLERMAHYDPLTNLPNRLLFSDRLKQAMTAADRKGTELAVLYLDLDGFKAVNDTYGHQIGDKLLQMIGERILREVRASDTFARLGGDEFIAMLVDKEQTESDVEYANRLLQIISEPVTIHDIPFSVSASIGIARYPQAQPLDADQLVRQADQAMYVAKTKGRNRFHFFDDAIERDVIEHEKLLQRVQRALDKDEFELYYQPKVNLTAGTVTGMEALLRWRDPERGFLAPGNFLPQIENHPLILKIDEWVIRHTLQQITAWRSVGLNIPVSANLSNLQLDQTDFVSKLKYLLLEFPEVPANTLELEIVESRALDNVKQASEIMQQCKQLGVSFALDDFGTGYSSLTYLKKLPVQTLKIDRGFVRDMLVDSDDQAILEGLLALGQTFGLNLIVEGAETLEQCKRLVSIGLPQIQGYYIARPMPSEEVISWIDKWQPPSF